jgi:hypothetical protein
MNAHPADSGSFEQLIPFVPVGAGADWPPVGLTPDEVAVLPGRPSGHAFLELGGSVRFECRYELRGKRDRAPALDEPTSGSLRRPDYYHPSGSVPVQILLR